MHPPVKELPRWNDEHFIRLSTPNSTDAFLDVASLDVEDLDAQELAYLSLQGG